VTGIRFRLIKLPAPRAVSSGEITPNEATAKVLGHTVKAFEVAEAADRITSIEQLSDAELLRIIHEHRAKEVATPKQGLKLLKLRPL